MIGQQISYWILTHFKEALQLIQDKEMEELEGIVHQEFTVPTSDCALAGDRQSECWMALEPRLNTPIEELIITDNYDRVEWFAPNEQKRNEKGYADVHAAIEITTDKPLLLEFEVPEKMSNNHQNGEVWVVLCAREEYENAIIFLDDTEIHVDIVDENFDKIRDFEISDPHRPSQKEHKTTTCMALGTTTVGTHTLSIQKEGFTFTHLFFA